ncbi:CFC_HP_G0008430.mRNA.1.CDS.1 [Saccharomyces cerevisiae]|nr:CFC_HP_G0008430.mRNA.1.CDS.1 [Saccharomyces cerevisiae]CAI6925394.1 CFC_HP_G0008430.mRNA.1.CDS.1 [Saccharomyces cerevisiae]
MESSTPTTETAKNIDSQLKKRLSEQWFKDVDFMVQRLHHVRQEMFDRLVFDLVNSAQQYGMFYYTRFDPKQVEILRNNYFVLFNR